ncbi:MAG: ABC transporter permease [Granulosicoccus sp.]
MIESAHGGYSEALAIERNSPKFTTVTADQAVIPGDQSALAAVGRESRIWIVFYAAVLLLCLVPFFLVIVISFGEKIEGASWRWAFDLSNYQRFFVGIDWPQSISFLYSQKLMHSFYYATIASLLAVVFAFPFTYLLTRLSKVSQTLWLIFLLSTVSLSEVFVVMGWAVLLYNRSGLPMVLRETGITNLFKELGWFQQFRDWGLANPRDFKFKTSVFATILTMSYLVWPYAVILLYPALSRVDQQMIDAARTMGATPVTVVRTVVLPATKVAVIGATLLLFVFLLGTYVAVTVFAAPRDQTLTISIYESIRGQTLNAPFGSAQAVVLLLVAGCLLWLSKWLTGLKDK